MSKLAALMKQQDLVDGRKRRSTPRPPRIRHPREVEREMSRDLRPLLIGLESIVMSELMPFLETLVREQTASRPAAIRQDAAGDDLFRIFSGIRLQVGSLFSDDIVRRIAAKSGNSVSAINQRILSEGLRRATGVNVFFDQPWLENELSLFNINNANLITKASSETINKIESRVFEGIRTGERWETIAKDIRKTINPRTGNAIKRAKLIARDQVSKLNGQINMLRQTELGITRYRWRTSRDDRVRDSHRAKDGKIFQWDKPPADTGHPGEDINCRCIAEPVLDDLI